MFYSGVITDFNFMPMVEPKPSTLRFWVRVPGLSESIEIEVKDSIGRLSQKFKFIIQDEYTWDFAGFKGRRCRIREVTNGYQFIDFIEENSDEE